MRPKAAGNSPQRISGLLQRFKLTRSTKVAANALQGLPLNAGADIIEHQAAHPTRLQVGADRHANQAAHAGAKPVQPAGLQLPNQGQHIGGIGWHLVGHGVGQPVAIATAHHVWADHPQALAGARTALTQGLGQHIEVAPLAGQPMHAQHHMVSPSLTPGPVGHAVATAGIGAMKKVAAWLSHGEIGLG